MYMHRCRITLAKSVSLMARNIELKQDVERLELPFPIHSDVEKKKEILEQICHLAGLASDNMLSREQLLMALVLFD